eukprot:379901-Prorocentrum_lima.AAC.1
MLRLWGKARADVSTKWAAEQAAEQKMQHWQGHLLSETWLSEALGTKVFGQPLEGPCAWKHLVGHPGFL